MPLRERVQDGVAASSPDPEIDMTTSEKVAGDEYG
jgi:hypothetical protein